MKIVFFGTPEFSVPALELLAAKHSVLGVLTQPDRPSGRGKKLTQSPVKAAALKLDVPVFQPETLKLCNTRDIRHELKCINADIFVVAAYGLMLPRGILNMPPLGSVNIHASLLPMYRGASPIHGALLNGDDETGISIMQMDEGLDTGDVLLQESLSISPGEVFASLHDRMAELGAKCIIKALESAGSKGTPQDESKASYAPIIKKSDGEINWRNPTKRIINQVRAYNSWPGTYTYYKDKPIKIWGIHSITDSCPEAMPGTVVVSSSKDGLAVKTGDGLCKITEIQGLGGKRMITEAFLRGSLIEKDVVLGIQAKG